MTDQADSKLSLSRGENCWTTATASRFGWLIDGEDYFRALRDAFDAAQQEIIIIGWDIDSRVELIRDPEDSRYPSPLCATLESLVDQRPDLQIHILSWDFAALYMLERELLPAMSFGWTTSERMHFKLDDRHAHAASHHQKIVIVDGKVGFVGGFDLTRCRWDTRAHLPDDERRQDSDGNRYRPFHDVQAIVSGDVVGDLRRLASERWEGACGAGLGSLESDDRDVWPDSAAVQARDVNVALARTWTDIGGERRIQEIEQLYLDMIANAGRYIYIENQYFTSPAIAEALAKRLQQQDGPEIVIVLPGVTSGWLEQATMDMLRNRALDALRKADTHDRLRVLAPRTDAVKDSSVNVHAKLMVVDFRWLRIGSANLSRRSMGLDTECDLLVDTGDGDAALAFCADLLGEHLHTDRESLRDALRADGLIAAIEQFNGGSHRLDALQIEPGEYDSWLEPLADIADMEQPVLNRLGESESDDAQTQGAGETAQQNAVQTPVSGWLFLLVVAGIIGFWVYWIAAGSAEDVDLAQLLNRMRGFAGHPLAPLAMITIIVAASLLVAPITGMIAICALLFSPWTASATALAGTLIATAVNHWVGRRFGNILTRRVPDRISSRIAKLGASSDVLSLAALRLIPIAPFTVINLMVGAAGVGLRPFITGTLIGMGPGIVLICLSVDRARAVLSGESVFDPWIITAITAAAIAFIALRFWLKRDGHD